ncbi:MAG: hypothetical protein ACTMIR_03845 [Cellulomonadaceae bacterium]
MTADSAGAAGGDEPTDAVLQERTVVQLIVHAGTSGTPDNPYGPHGPYGPVSLDVVTAALRARRIVAAAGPGARIGLPETVVALVVTDGAGRVLVEADGALFPGQEIEALVPGLAHTLGATIVVDSERSVLPDGSQIPLDEDAMTHTLGPSRTRAVYAMRLAPETTSSMHALAGLAASSVEYAVVGDWAVAATPVGTAQAVSPALARREHPFAALVRDGQMRRVVWHPRPGATHVVEIVARPDLERVLPGPEHGEAARLGGLLARGRVTVHSPGAGAEQDEPRADRLRTIDGDFFESVARELDLPEEAAREAERDPEPLLDLPGTRHIERPRGLASAVGTGLSAMILEEPRGTGWYQRYRRFMWHHLAVLVALSLTEIAAGAALVAWQLIGDPQLWPLALWIVTGYLLLDGLSDLVAGILLVRRRHRANPGGE